MWLPSLCLHFYIPYIAYFCGKSVVNYLLQMCATNYSSSLTNFYLFTYLINKKWVKSIVGYNSVSYLILYQGDSVTDPM